MKLLTTIFLTLLCIAAFAQTTVTLDSVLVTASRIETTIPQSGKSVTVLKAKEIEALPVTSVDELLRFITGVNVNARNAFGVQTDFGMRGSTFSQVLVMVDNIRLNDPLTAHFNNNFPVSVAEIDQIEIIRGPASTSYGPDAVGGVIHIKTKTYTSLGGTPQNTVRTSGQLGVGAHNLFIADAGILASGKKWQISAGAKTNISDGETLFNPNFNLVDGVDSLYNNYFDLRTYTVSAAYFLNDSWKAYARFGYDRRNFSAKYFYTRSSFDESTEFTDSYWTQFALRRSKGNHTTELNIGHKKSSDIFTFNPLFAPNEHIMHSTVVNLNHHADFNERSQLAVGAQLWNRAIESTDRGNHEDMAVGIYGVYSYLLRNDLRTVASLRLDYDENYNVEVLPQLSISYFKDDYTLRASVGRTVRAADFTERFVSFNLPNLSPGRNVGNPDLSAETSYSMEIGADYIPSPRALFSGTVFYRTSDNLVDYALTNADEITNVFNLQAGEDYFYARNVADAQTVGFELQAQQAFLLGQSNRQLDLKAGYTYLSTSQSGEPSRYIANHPTHNLNGMLSYRGKVLHLNLALNYIERDGEFSENIGAEVRNRYTVVNANAALQIIPQHFSVFCNIQNVFDTQYQEILGAQMPSRWIMGGIKWNVSQ